MDNIDMTLLVSLLNKKKISVDDSKTIYSIICRGFNCYSSYKDIVNSIISQLNRIGKKHFWAIWAVCGMELAYNYISHNKNMWDERKRKSSLYSFSHLSYINEKFSEYTGFTLPLDSLVADDICNESFSHWFRLQIYKNSSVPITNSDLLWLCHIASAFVDLHSTLKQSFFGGTVLTFDETQSFPLI